MPATSQALELTALTTYPESVASARVRIVEMGRHLERHGVSVSYAATLSESEYRALTGGGSAGDLVAALAKTQMRAFRGRRPPSHGLMLVHRLPSLLPQATYGLPIDIYDFDDAIYLGHESGSGGMFRGLLKREAVRSRNYMRAARLVLAGNSVLATAATEYATRVEVVPSCVDPWLQPLRSATDTDTITLGWTGSRTTSGYLRPIFEAVDRMRSRGARVRLILMGADRRLTGPGIEHRLWSVHAERQLLSEIDVGVMPLRDDPWTRGKCGYKLLRYFAAGLPTIGSPVGVNAELLHGGAGLAAFTASDFMVAIGELRSDPAARTQRGIQARGFVEREYSFQVWAPRLTELLRDLSRDN